MRKVLSLYQEIRTFLEEMSEIKITDGFSSSSFSRREKERLVLMYPAKFSEDKEKEKLTIKLRLVDPFGDINISYKLLLDICRKTEERAGIRFCSVNIAKPSADDNYLNLCAEIEIEERKETNNYILANGEGCIWEIADENYLSIDRLINANGISPCFIPDKDSEVKVI